MLFRSTILDQVVETADILFEAKCAKVVIVIVIVVAMRAVYSKRLSEPSSSETAWEEPATVRKEASSMLTTSKAFYPAS